MSDLGRLIIIVGIVIVIIGIFVTYNSKIPFIGKLPGDIYYHKEGFTFYFPLTTSIIIGIIISLILRFLNK
jgi:hypothetical protein